MHYLRSILLFAFIPLCALAPVTGCGPSESEVEQALEEANYCAAPEECVVLSPGCPLGCYALVNQDEVEAMERLIDDYFASHGHTCDYDCIAISEPRCENGRCVADPLE